MYGLYVSPLCFGSCSSLCLEHLATGHSLTCPRLFRLPVPGKQSHPKPERLLSLLNSEGPLLSLIAFITPFVALWIILFFVPLLPN